MKSFGLSTYVLALLLSLSTGLFALAEVRTAYLDSAIPHTAVDFFICSAFMGSGVKDIPGKTQEKIDSSVTGGRFSLRVHPKIEASFLVCNNDYNTALELQAKILFHQYDRTYLSVAPCIYNSKGRRNKGPNIEECSLNGFGLPLILTMDTGRNLTLNLAAGVNFDVVRANGKTVRLDDELYQYVTTNYDYDSIHATRGNINFSIDAKAGPLYMIPELGITFADAHDQGVVRFINWGVKIGFRL